MFKKLKENGWVLAILIVINLWSLGVYFEYTINREMIKEVQFVLTLGVLVFTIYVVKLITEFIHNFIKKEEND